MSGRDRRAARRRFRAARRRSESTDGHPDETDVSPAQPLGIVGEDPLVALARSSCPECGEPIQWLPGTAVAERDPVLFDQLVVLLGPDAPEQADLWTCPACDAAGIVTDDDPDAPPAPSPYDPDEQDEQNEQDEQDGSRALDDLLCGACGSPLEWLDPARVASIDKAAYRRALAEYGPEALLEGDAAACWRCGTITFHPDDG